MLLRSLKTSAIPHAVILIAGFFALSPAVSPVRAQAPKSTPDEMIALGRQNLETKFAELLPKVKDAATTLGAIRELNDFRRLAQRAVALDYPLDDFTGIVLVDSFDEKYAAVVDSVVQHFTSLDRTLPSQDAVALFRDRLGELPPVGDTPAGYVVAFVIGRCAQAATGLSDSLAPELRSDVAEVAVRAIGGLAHAFSLTRTGEAREKSDDVWHLSVIQRMRCGTHGSGYTMQEERNGLKADGTLYRRYVIRCDKGTETRKIDFDLGEMGTLTQTGGRQNLKKAPRNPASRKPGVDP